MTLVPLDGAKGSSSNSPGAAAVSGRVEPSGSPESPDRTITAPGDGGTSGTPAPTAEGGPGAGNRTTPPAAPPTPTPGRSKAPTAADLSWGAPVTGTTDQRWCQKVTVDFHNSGGTAVRSGSVTFGTHVIGTLGIDWGTIDSAVGLPAPIAPGAHSKPTWTVCVDAWRVPLGMHIETRDVSVRWK